MSYKLYLPVLFLLVSLSADAQYWRSDTARMYSVNPWISGAIVAVGVPANIYGIKRVQEGDRTPEATVLALTPDNVNGFDRWVLDQDDVVALRERETWKPRDLSDLGMISGGLLPFALALDKNVRREWMDVLPMYLEAQVITANMWAWSPVGPAVVSRYRPFVYYDNYPLDERTKSERRASFYSGHVASSAVGAMFTARVICDYHPELGNRKWMVYAGASLFPIWTGYWRIKDLAHFPSDVIVGAAIGSAIGILVPQIHKNKRRKFGLSVIYNEDVKAVGMVIGLNRR